MEPSQFILKIIPYRQLNTIKLLGEGYFGITYKATWRNSCISLKLTKEQPGDKEWEIFDKILHIPPHKNVLPIIGFCPNFEIDKPEYQKKYQGVCIVTSFCEKGNLRNLLIQEKNILLNNPNSIDPKDRLSSTTSIISIAFQIAQGLSHLHKHDIIHQNIAAHNVIISTEGNAMLSDFGPYIRLPQNISSYYKVDNNPKSELPLRWLAPESITVSHFSDKSDVWMFGVFLWEMLSLGLHPYNEIDNNIDIIEGIKNRTISLSIPPDSHPIIQTLLSSCFQYNPEDRPSMPDVVEILQQINLNNEEKSNVHEQSKTFNSISQLSLVESKNNIEESMNLKPNQSQTNIEEEKEMKIQTNYCNFTLSDISAIKPIGINSNGNEVIMGMIKATKQKMVIKPLNINKCNPKSLNNAFEQLPMLYLLDHENIVKFIGSSFFQPFLYIIIEYCNNGNLYDFLINEEKYTNISFECQLGFALDIAKGMQYLHNSCPSIIHRLLCSESILIDENWKVKITDYWESFFEGTDSNPVGIPCYMAPEVIISEVTNKEKIDVYSYGIILWEIMTRLEPYEDIEYIQIVVEVVNGNLRPSIPSSLSHHPFVSLMKSCWQAQPSQRPSFNEIVESLSKMDKFWDYHQMSEYKHNEKGIDVSNISQRGVLGSDGVYRGPIIEMKQEDLIQ